MSGSFPASLLHLHPANRTARARAGRRSTSPRSYHQPRMATISEEVPEIPPQVEKGAKGTTGDKGAGKDAAPKAKGRVRRRWTRDAAFSKVPC